MIKMSQIFRPDHHYDELDSLRGLAAITVVITHFTNLFLVQAGPFVSLGQFIHSVKSTPFSVLLAGHQAVMLFFVHSGFVLSLQFMKGKSIGYGSFAIRRIFRIYVPYLVTLVLALACCAILYSGPIADLSNWFNTPWSDGITGTSVGGHLLFIGSFKSDRFDPVLWSLVHELRISFLFPFLVVFLMKKTWKANLLLAFALSFVGMTMSLALIKFGISVDYFLTVHYISMFIAGFLLAQNINAICAWYRSLGGVARMSLAVAGFCMYTFSHILPGRLGYFQDIPIAIGAVFMIIVAVCSVKTSAFLKRPLLTFFGRISYSLYLYHAVLLLSFTHMLYGRMPIAVILFIAAVMTVPVSWLSYTYVELPAIRSGKLLAARWENRKPASAGSVLPSAPVLNQ
jgi:peptidoglycan/LPS O-acetylase OafA/YrhL